jgi:hypothetical protein
MNPLKLLAILVTAALAVLTFAAGFTQHSSPAVGFWLALSIGVLGLASHQFLPAYVPSFLPPQVATVLSRLGGFVGALLGIIGPIASSFPPAAHALWIATVVVGAISTVTGALLPSEPTTNERRVQLRIPLSLVAVVLCGSLAGCALIKCYQPADPTFNSVGCQAERAAVNCVEENAITLGPMALGILENLLMSLVGQPVSIDWVAIEQAAGGAGLKAVACFFAAVEGMFTAKVAAAKAAHGGLEVTMNSPVWVLEQQHASFRTFFDGWKKSHGFGATASFKLAGAVVR